MAGKSSSDESKGVKRRVVDHRLALAWLVAFLIGAALIIQRRPEDVTSLRGTYGPCIVLLLYALYGLRLRNRNTSKFADSTYFMGFIWTLLALIDAVIEEKIQANAVFRAFGYALVITGLGMFLRVLIIQFHETIPDQLEDAQDTIDERLRSFASELSAASDQARRFRADVDQQLRSEVSSLASAAAAIRSEIENVHGEAARISLEAVGEAVEKLNQELARLSFDSSSLRKDTDAFVRQVKSSSGRIERAAERFSEKVEAAGDKAASSLEDAVEGRFAEIPKRAKQDAERFAQLMESAATTLQSAPDSLERLVGAIDDIRGRLANVDRQIGASMAEELGRTIENLDMLSRRVAEARGASDNLATATSELVSFLRSELRRS